MPLGKVQREVSLRSKDRGICVLGVNGIRRWRSINIERKGLELPFQCLRRNVYLVLRRHSAHGCQCMARAKADRLLAERRAAAPPGVQAALYGVSWAVTVATMMSIVFGQAAGRSRSAGGRWTRTSTGGEEVKDSSEGTSRTHLRPALAAMRIAKASRTTLCRATRLYPEAHAAARVP